MLGSLHDAEEAAQETLVRAWQAMDELEAADAIKGWLYRIATNVCLDVLKKRRRRQRVLPFMRGVPADPAAPWGPPEHESVWVEPVPDTLLEAAGDARERPDVRVSLRESVALAFVAALQILPGKQRAALLLMDVLGWTPEETASLLATSVAATNSLLQRARRTVEGRVANRSELVPSEEDNDLLRRYIVTWENRDLDALVALIAEDAVLSMPPQPEWYRGREAIRTFLARMASDLQRRYRSVATRANGGPAVAVYVSMAGGPFKATAINVLSFRKGLVARMTRFTSHELFPRFGLPAELPEQADE
jgi:RNA polymerase sigma-70 factor (ECF subfamily)